MRDIVPSCLTLCDPMDYSTTGFPVLHYLPSLSFTVLNSSLKLMTIESVMPYNHFTLCHPLLLLPSIFPSIRVYSNESAIHLRWPKYWSLGLTGLISMQSKELLRVFSNTTVDKHQFLGAQLFLLPSSHIHT